MCSATCSSRSTRRASWSASDVHGAVLVWEFHFGVRLWGRRRAQVIHGASHLKFAADGKVLLHRDYWDTGEEIYMKLPVLGLLMRTLRRWLAA